MYVFVGAFGIESQNQKERGENTVGDDAARENIGFHEAQIAARKTQITEEFDLQAKRENTQADETEREKPFAALYADQRDRNPDKIHPFICYLG